MTALESHLKQTIADSGPISVETFMEACLYHPEHGYYTHGLNFTDPASPRGRDFATAPELTPLFGATLAEWVAGHWQHLDKPASFTMAEVGPGRGTLSASLLAHLQAAHPACFAATQPWLVETSAVLTHVQKQTLAPFAAQWACEISQLPNTPTILIANELLDAFPVRQFAADEERMVTLEDDELTFSHADDAVTREESPAQATWLDNLKGLPNLAAALLIDYGYTAGAGDSLQAMHRHRQVSPLHLPGETDITSHVNFTTVAETLGNCRVANLADFLLEAGLLPLAEPTINTAETAASLHRLIHPEQMGILFKVLEYRPR